MSNSLFTSEVSICNQALSWLGVSPITSFADKSIAAEVCKLNYSLIRDAVLTEVAWTFATDRATSTVADRDGWDQKFRHSIPTDWLQVLRVYRNVNSDRKIRSDGWSREGSFILTKEPVVYMWGIKRITDTALFSPAFIQCLAARIAADLCITFTEDTRKQVALWQLYDVKLREAANADGVQGANEIIQSNTLIDTRSGGI